jgi:hypothetical protein
VDTNTAFRESLAQRLQASDLEAVTAASDSAFHLLRAWDHPVDRLYPRADLPGLIDGSWLTNDMTAIPIRLR